MAKTLVKPEHDPGPATNGDGGCHARWGHDGMCPGVRNAAWLNELGEDEEIFHFYGGITNFDVRKRHVESGMHVMWQSTPEFMQCPTCKGKGEVRKHGS